MGWKLPVLGECVIYVGEKQLDLSVLVLDQGLGIVHEFIERRHNAVSQRKLMVNLRVHTLSVKGCIFFF